MGLIYQHKLLLKAKFQFGGVIDWEVTTDASAIELIKTSASKLIKKSAESKLEFDYESFKKGIARVESNDGKFMKNKTSTATGLYGQLFSEIQDLPEMIGINRDQFAKNLDLQNQIFEIRYNQGINGAPSIKKSIKDLTKDYQSALGDRWQYTPGEVGALVNYLGRQGARNYFKSLIANKSYKVTGVNKSPLDYLKVFNSAKDERNRSKFPAEQARIVVTTPKLQRGGIVPRAPLPPPPPLSGPTPTYADSVAIYQNALLKQAFYINNPNYAEALSHTDFQDKVTRDNLIAEGSIFDHKIDQKQIDNFEADQRSLGEDRFGRVPGTNLTSFGDVLHGLIDSWYNPDSPPILLHPNISPQGITAYNANSFGDASDVPYYNPAVVKPWRDRTDAEKRASLPQIPQLLPMLQNTPNTPNTQNNQILQNTPNTPNTPNTQIPKLPQIPREVLTPMDSKSVSFPPYQFPSMEQSNLSVPPLPKQRRNSGLMRYADFIEPELKQKYHDKKDNVDIMSWKEYNDLTQETEKKEFDILLQGDFTLPQSKAIWYRMHPDERKKRSEKLLEYLQGKALREVGSLAEATPKMRQQLLAPKMQRGGLINNSSKSKPKNEIIQPQPRKGVRENLDGSFSTHLMEWGSVDNGFVAYPTLFQEANGNWTELNSNDAFERSKQSGELVFFETKNAAKKWAEGSWKGNWNQDYKYGF